MAQPELSPEFKRLIKNVETGTKVKVYLTFKDEEDLRHSTAIFFKRAVMSPHLAAKFVETANIFYFVQPEKCEINFRKGLVNECRKQIDIVNEAIEQNKEFIMGRATGTYKVFSELFNIGYILKGIVKKHLDFLVVAKHTSVMAHRCFYTVIETSRDKILNDLEDSFSLTHKKLVEMIEAATTPDEEPKVAVKPKVTGDLFPPLDGSASVTQHVTSAEDLKIIASLVTKVATTNNTDIFKEIIATPRVTQSTQNYIKLLEAFIEKAFTSPEVSSSLLSTCKLLIRYPCDAWNDVKIEDVKKIAQKFTLKQINELLANPQNGVTEAYPIIQYIKKLLELSLCSNGCLISFIEAFFNAAEQKNYNAPDILKDLIFSVKLVKSADQMKKIKQSVRVKILLTVARQDAARSSEVKVTPQLNTLAQYLDLKAKEVLTMPEGSSMSSYSPVGSVSSYRGYGFYGEDDSADSDEETPEVAAKVVNNFLPKPKAKFKESSGSSSPINNHWNTRSDPQHPAAVQPQPQISSVNISELKHIDPKDLGSFAETFMKSPNLTIDDLQFMADYIMRTVLFEEHSKRIAYYSQLVCMLRDVRPKTGPNERFETVFDIKCREIAIYLDAVTDTEDTKECYNIAEFICHLFTLRVITIEIVQIYLHLYLRKTDDFSTHCIHKIIEIIGPQNISPQLLDVYFLRFDTKSRQSMEPVGYLGSKIFHKLFQMRQYMLMQKKKKQSGPFDSHLVSNGVGNHETSRTLTPPIVPVVEEKNLGAIRKSPTKVRPDVLPATRFNGNSEPKSPEKEVNSKIELRNEEFFLKHPEVMPNEESNLKITDLTKENGKMFIINDKTTGNPESFQKLITDLKEKIENPAHMDNIIEAMLDKSIVCRYTAPSCIKIFKEFSKISKIFSDKLSEKMMVRCVRSGYDESSLSNLFIILCELYREDIFADDNFLIWTLQRHMSQIPPDYLSQISSIITPKVQHSGNIQIENLLQSLELSVHLKTLDLCSSIHQNIDELANLLTAKLL